MSSLPTFTIMSETGHTSSLTSLCKCAPSFLSTRGCVWGTLVLVVGALCDGKLTVVELIVCITGAVKFIAGSFDGGEENGGGGGGSLFDDTLAGGRLVDATAIGSRGSCG